MAKITWRGLGILMPFIWIASVAAGVLAGIGVEGSSQREIGPVTLVAAAVMVVLAPSHWLLGLAVNRVQGPRGRMWMPRHSFGGLAVQWGFVPQAVFASMMASLVVGKETTALLGWPMLIACLVGVWGLCRLVDRAGGDRVSDMDHGAM